VRTDPVLSDKRTIISQLAPAKPEVLNRKIAKVQFAPGGKESEYLACQLSAPFRSEVTGDMGCIDNIKRSVAKGCFPYICDQDPDPARLRTGIPA
jgi:hypothetical protein